MADLEDYSAYDFMEIPQSAGLLKDVSAMGARLATLARELEKAENRAKDLKKEYLHLKDVAIPNFMEGAGLSEITLSGGEKLSIKTKFACSPNKNAVDQATMIAFLRGHGGADMVKSEAVVEGKDSALLDAAGIEYNLSEAVNTNSLKAWLKESLGYGDTPPTLEAGDVPACINFYKWKEAEVTFNA